MANNKQHIHYSKIDIDLYLQGKMSKVEMHNIERAALQDPFLADAIEGYSIANAATSTKNLASIEAAILGKKVETKVVPFAPTPKNILIKVAAVTIGIVVISGIGILLLKKENKEIIASNEVVANTKVEKTSPATNIDSIELQEKELATESKKTLNNIPSLKTTTSTKTLMQDNVTDDAALEEKTTPAIVAHPSLNKWNATIAGPSISNNANGNYNSNISKNIAKDDAVLLKESEAIVTTENKAKKETIVLPIITLKIDTTFIPVATTSISSKRAAAKPINITLTKQDSALVPINGWVAYNKYLQINHSATIVYDTIFSPFTTTNAKTGDEIVGLEFDIDQFGNPERIKITKSVDAEKDAKAIELLKNGPRWANKIKLQKGKIAIKL